MFSIPVPPGLGFEGGNLGCSGNFAGMSRILEGSLSSPEKAYKHKEVTPKIGP